MFKCLEINNSYKFILAQIELVTLTIQQVLSNLDLRKIS